MGSSNSCIHDPEIKNMEAIKSNPLKVSIKKSASMPVPQQWYQSQRRLDRKRVQEQARKKSMRILQQIRETQVRFHGNVKATKPRRNLTNSGEKDDGRIKKPTCYRCSLKGHFAWDCPRKPSRSFNNDRLFKIMKPERVATRIFLVQAVR